MERLVDGHWVPARRPRRFDEKGGWEQLAAPELELHERRYLLADALDAAGLGWGGRFGERLRRTAVWRLVSPPLGGGARRTLSREEVEAGLEAHVDGLADVKGRSLDAAKEQAQTGFEGEGERLGILEQRANYFLGAAGLTTTLVLANAGLLLGTGKVRLEAPWLELAAAALALASLCTLAAGLRAMQAAMATFARVPPNSIGGVLARSRLGGANRSTRAYVAALLVAHERTWVVGEWKLRRLRSARRWFTFSVAAIVTLTIFVLLDALSRAG